MSLFCSFVLINTLMTPNTLETHQKLTYEYEEAEIECGYQCCFLYPSNSSETYRWSNINIQIKTKLPKEGVRQMCYQLTNNVQIKMKIQKQLLSLPDCVTHATYSYAKESVTITVLRYTCYKLTFNIQVKMKLKKVWPSRCCVTHVTNSLLTKI